MTERITVILSAYNGEKYIQSQIDSILNQTYDNFILYIRDDGSTDGTRKILKQYSEKDSRVKVQYGENIGYVKSFFKMLSEVNSEYIAFSDQDDIWLPEKLSVAQAALSQKNKSVPLMWASNIYICDEKMNVISIGARKRMSNFSNSLFMCNTQGMTMIINNKAREKVVSNLPKQNIMYHDWWIYRVVSAFGEVIFDSDPYVKYRRHDKNESDISYNFVNKVTNMMNRLINSDMYIRTKKETQEFKIIFDSQLSQSNRDVLSLFASLKRKIQKVFYSGRLKNSVLDELVLRLFFLLDIL